MSTWPFSFKAYTVQNISAMKNKKDNFRTICKAVLFSVLSEYSLSSKTDRVWVTTMERLDHGHLHPKLDLHFWARNRTRASSVGGEHSSKELFVQRINSYSEHLLYMRQNLK